MKYLIIFILSINTALACQISIPESYIPTFLNPPVSGHYEKCENKPEEKCHCVESVDPWTSEFIEGEFKVSGDKLTAQLNKENSIKAKEAAKKAAKEALKSADLDGANSIAKLKAIIKLMLEAQGE